MAYNNIKIFGKQRVDYLIQTNSVLSDEDIESTMGPEFMPDFNTFSDSINIMAPYTNDIVSSVISGLTEPLIGWQIYRRDSNNSFLKKIAEVDKESLGIVDYLTANQTNYEYYVIPVTEKQLGIILKSGSVKTCWWNWCLMSIKNVSDNIFIPDEIWTFDNNLSSGDIISNTDKTIYQNFTQYPKFSVGESNYISGNISCLLGNVDCKTNTYNETVEMMNAWKKFCISEKDMILKDRKGNMYKVVITDNSSKFLDESSLQPSTISFSFTECGNIDNMTIYENGIIDFN